MEAHRAYERFEQGHQVGGGERHGREAALVVAVIACLLAVATFLSNEAVKEVITGETHRADASAQLESNRVKIDIARGNSSLLRVLGTGIPSERRAAAAAREHEGRVFGELRPVDSHLDEEIAAHEGEVEDANVQHVDFELSEVGFEVGIVLASVSIIAGRRWLLGAAGAAATAGLALLAAGLLFV
jgi:hypothetical protein